MSLANNTPNPEQKTAHILTQTFRFDKVDLEPQKPRGTKAFLNVIRSRANLGAYVFIDGPIFVGRDPSCNIPLQDLGVSRRHVMISPSSDGQFVLTDLKSTNGTWHDGLETRGAGP